MNLFVCDGGKMPVKRHKPLLTKRLFCLNAFNNFFVGEEHETKSGVFT